MKKLFYPVLSLLLATPGFVSAAHTYDFTNWSAKTVENLIADSQASASSGWSDDEKNDGNSSGNKAFWMAADNVAVGKDGNLTANSVLIDELNGLDFSPAPTSRNLAIAVDYPSTSLGEYHGGSYLWLGGSKKDYFVMRNVKGGSTIKMGVESHKPAEGRGVELYVYSDNTKGDKLKGTDGNDVAVPTVYEEQEWQVPAGGPVDVLVYNTNGCHLYYIDVDMDGTSGTEPSLSTFVANCDNASTNIPASGTSCKSITWNINDGISFTISTADEGFRSTSKPIQVNGKLNNAIYMLSTGSTASKTYTIAKTGDITKVTMYAYYNNDGDASATIYLDPEGENTPETIYGMGGSLTSIDLTDIETIKICSNGMMVAFEIEYIGEPVEEPEPEQPENLFVANSDNADKNIPSSGTSCKEINWTIDENTSFTLSTAKEAFRSNTKAIRVNGTNYNPVYFLSTGGEADKLFSLKKQGGIEKITMYAHYNNNENTEATIYLNPEGENTPVSIYGFAGDLVSVDVTNVESLMVCSGGFMAVFAIELSEEPGEEPGPDPEEPANPYIADGLNPNQTLSEKGTDVKTITYTINDKTSFGISTEDEGFRKGNANQGFIIVDDKEYTPVYMLSTSSTASKMYSFTKSENVNKVMMYAYYNNAGSATIYINPDAENTPVEINSYTSGPLAEIDITECDSMKICSNGLIAVFAVYYGDGEINGVESIENEQLDNVETVYYNLQGVRVANPEKGIYVRVRGNKVDKVYVR